MAAKNESKLFWVTSSNKLVQRKQHLALQNHVAVDFVSAERLGRKRGKFNCMRLANGAELFVEVVDLPGNRKLSVRRRIMSRTDNACGQPNVIHLTPPESRTSASAVR